MQPAAFFLFPTQHMIARRQAKKWESGKLMPVAYAKAWVDRGLAGGGDGMG